MGFDYLGGGKWSDVTREERYFTLVLYNAINKKGVLDFVDFLRNKCYANLDYRNDWELAYEVCFYRDLWYLRKKCFEEEGLIDDDYSKKRTFDLCLFSCNQIVVIEAKAHERLVV